jgi:hypothetical protein
MYTPRTRHMPSIWRRLKISQWSVPRLNTSLHKYLSAQHRDNLPRLGEVELSDCCCFIWGMCVCVHFVLKIKEISAKTLADHS